MRVKIEISLKDGVLDPQAKAIYNALLSLKFNCVNNVRILKTILIDIDTESKDIALSEADKMCKVLLANLVIETYKIEIES